MEQDQMQLSFEQRQIQVTISRSRQRRHSRARWWFDQMHAVVDRAFDWSRGNTPPPEQIYFRLARGR